MSTKKHKSHTLPTSQTQDWDADLAWGRAVLPASSICLIVPVKTNFPPYSPVGRTCTTSSPPPAGHTPPHRALHTWPWEECHYPGYPPTWWSWMVHSTPSTPRNNPPPALSSTRSRPPSPGEVPGIQPSNPRVALPFHSCQHMLSHTCTASLGVSTNNHLESRFYKHRKKA